MGRIVNLQELLSLRASLRSEGKRVVFTNGCFDILHRGHVEFLNQAKSFGDVLIIGLNSDSSVRRIKGKNRPIVREDDRALILANLIPVDFVTIFDEDTPLQTISALLPDILVKGADWGLDEVVGKDTVERSGGVVRTIPLVPNHSTTDLIQTIVENFGDGR